MKGMFTLPCLYSAPQQPAVIRNSAIYMGLSVSLSNMYAVPYN